MGGILPPGSDGLELCGVRSIDNRGRPDHGRPPIQPPPIPLNMTRNQNYPVTKIGSLTFMFCDNLSSVNIADSVLSIASRFSRARGAGGIIENGGR